MIYAGVFLANGKIPHLQLSLLILSAAIGARIIAMTLNRIIDRKIDIKNPRTLNRELPSGKLSLIQGYIVLFFGFAIYLTSAYLISDFCFYLSPIR